MHIEQQKKCLLVIFDDKTNVLIDVEKFEDKDRYMKIFDKRGGVMEVHDNGLIVVNTNGGIETSFSTNEKQANKLKCFMYLNMKDKQQSLEPT